ncbi:MFS general substrate transporter [Polychaeton citri CBS 116435]|uniref:MFS general substrate transporter n=1 Tax=Polychaeton citri CBS 116435 TaxID=1314669 RepID=A0A9P4QEF5_9PEZI|nr:MFS general substrate transporter [Polychaeton citri CBS 116435]
MPTETLTISPEHHAGPSLSTIWDEPISKPSTAVLSETKHALESEWSAPATWGSNIGGSHSPPRHFQQMVNEDGPTSSPVHVKQSWRKPKGNLARLAAVLFAMFNLGIHDAAYGPLIPYLERYYGLSYTTVSLVFLAAFPGYVLAAGTNDRLHLLVGPRGVAAIASTFRLCAYIALSCHPPWAVIVILLVFCGWGNGLLDAAWNAWAAELDRPSEILGALHGMYGLGAAVSPIVASSMIDQHGLPWFRFYYIPLALTALELAAGVSAFWKYTGAKFRRDNTNEGQAGGRTRAALKSRVTWMIAVFLLLYTGAEVSLSGWVVTFMMRVRGAEAFPSAMTSTGFWLGVTTGRVVLGFVTPKLGERWAITGYLVLAMALELVFWLVPQFIVSAVAVALLGFVLGPM